MVREKNTKYREDYITPCYSYLGHVRALNLCLVCKSEVSNFKQRQESEAAKLYKLFIIQSDILLISCF